MLGFAVSGFTVQTKRFAAASRKRVARAGSRWYPEQFSIVALRRYFDLAPKLRIAKLKIDPKLRDEIE